jgi:arylsulfatase A-like enzyme
LTLEDEYECKSQYDDYRTKLIRNGKTVDEQEYLTDAFSRDAQLFIQKNQKNPFFLYLAYNAPHTPLQATEKYLDRFPDIKDNKRKTYAAMVSAVDDGIKNILSTLQQLDIEDNTIVFFISDNGGPTNANASKNDPLRGAKGSFFEGGIRVPFVMQWKEAIPIGTIYDNPISSLDIFATCASIVGIKTKNKLDGKNLIPYVQNKDKGQPHDYLFWRHGSQNSHAVRSENLKLVQTKDSLFLFDIINDKSEKDNKSSIKTKEKDLILEKYQDWNKQMIGPKFLGLGEEKEYELKYPDRFKRNK